MRYSMGERGSGGMEQDTVGSNRGENVTQDNQDSRKDGENQGNNISVINAMGAKSVI